MTFDLKAKIITTVLAEISEETIEQAVEKQLGHLHLVDTQSIKDELLAELIGYGPIAPLLADPTITEILINDYDLIFAEKEGVLEKSEARFVNMTTYERFIKKILFDLDRVADGRHPLTDGTLPDGTRVHIALPPITRTPIATLRRHCRRFLNLEALQEQGLFPEALLTNLRKILEQKKNILICGATGTGKTTLLRAMLSEVPENERVITVEDTSEINLERKNSVSLLSRISLEGLFPTVNLNDLLRNALRMRPDRIVVGEIRSDEALIFLDAVSTGHSGSMSSIHGHSAVQALSRLEQLVSRNAPQWPQSTVRQLIKESVDVIICLRRKKGSRQIHEICEIAGLESFGFLLSPWEI